MTIQRIEVARLEAPRGSQCSACEKQTRRLVVMWPQSAFMWWGFCDECARRVGEAAKGGDDDE